MARRATHLPGHDAAHELHAAQRVAQTSTPLALPADTLRAPPDEPADVPVPDEGGGVVPMHTPVAPASATVGTPADWFPDPVAPGAGSASTGSVGETRPPLLGPATVDPCEASPVRDVVADPLPSGEGIAAAAPGAPAPDAGAILEGPVDTREPVATTGAAVPDDAVLDDAVLVCAAELGGAVARVARANARPPGSAGRPGPVSDAPASARSGWTGAGRTAAPPNIPAASAPPTKAPRPPRVSAAAAP